VRAAVRIGCGALALLASAVAAQAPAPTPSGEAASTATLPAFQPAATCGECHTRELEQWRESWMSRAWTARNFQHDVEALARAGETDRRFSPAGCLRCHAPLAVVLRDPGVERAISREGVSCDFCHSIASIGGSDGSGKLRLDPRGVRYGAPRGGAGADADPGKPAAPHPVGRTEALRDPRLCALCHSDFDRNGIPLERTYKEWLDSPYAQQGVVCVDCHMAPVEGDTTRVSHRFPGGHADSPLLPGTAVISVREADSSEVVLEVVNARAGHHFPTAGAHPNALHLEVVFRDAGGAALAEHRERFAFVYLDAQGREVEGGTTVVRVEDTTLAPLEPRRIRLPRPAGARHVEARLVYVALPAHMRDRVGEALYAESYAPVEIHRLERSLNP